MGYSDNCLPCSFGYASCWKKPLKQRAKIVEHLILLGFYQLAFSRVSQHAAVAETVAACNKLNNSAFKGLVNGILRNFIREEVAQQQPEDKQIRSGLPKWLFKQLSQHYPGQLDKLVENMQQRAPIWLRIAQQKISRNDYLNKLQEQGVQASIFEQHQDALVLASGGDITQLPGYQQGWFAVQDGAAQLAAAYLSPQPNERVLDCCAAPGGKTAHILANQPELQECVAVEVDAVRLEKINENLERLQHQATLICGDASQPNSWWDGQPFDRILLDAPCSATGIIRRYPDIKWLRKASDIEDLVALQRQILTAVWPLLKPAGTLLYATCSILPQENREQIQWFLSQAADAVLLPLCEGENRKSPGRQILPGEQQMDGFYYARLLKSAE